MQIQKSKDLRAGRNHTVAFLLKSYDRYGLVYVRRVVGEAEHLGNDCCIDRGLVPTMKQMTGPYNKS